MSLGNRMKEYYENRSKTSLMRRSYTLMRIDGKAFHTYTKGLDSPFDNGFIADMDKTAIVLCKKIQGAKLAYVQSDEISILLTDFETFETQAWFDYDVQKMTSVSASIATAAFNKARLIRWDIGTDIDSQCAVEDFNFAEFDSRVWQVPCAVEAANYFVWRQQDAMRNSIQSMAQSIFSQSQIHGINTAVLQEMCLEKGINWNAYSPRKQRGSIIRKIDNEWITDPNTPVFSKNFDYLNNLIPSMEAAYV